MKEYLKAKTLNMFAIISAIVLVLACSNFAVFADDDTECRYLSGSNINANDYYLWSKPVYSYLTTYGDLYMRVQGNAGEGIVAAYYDQDFKLQRRTLINKELPIFGGFYETGSNYFIVSGQENKGESDSVEVFRITKYDKNWSRKGSCSLYGANTYIPFDAGSCRMDASGKYLAIRTCHSMYNTGDGLHHQANVQILVDTSNMTVLDSFTKVWDKSVGYSSHSFNQFIHIVNNKLVGVDHGDAHPRALWMALYPTNITSGSFQGTVTPVYIKNIPGQSGDNYTNISAGAFEVSSTSYLVAGNSAYKNSDNSSGDRDVFVAAVNRSSNSVRTIWLTDVAGTGTSAKTPAMVKVSNDRYMVLWVRSGKVEYTFVDGNGNKTGSTYSLKGDLSDCVPLVSNGKVIWYTWNDKEETFYTIPVNDPGNPSKETVIYDHDYQIQSSENGLVTLKCARCGAVATGRVPTYCSTSWSGNLPSSNYDYWDQSLEIDITDTASFYIFTRYNADAEVSFDDLVLEMDDPENMSISYYDKDWGEISFDKTGTYKVTVYPKYNTALKEVYTIYVTKALEGVSLNVEKDSPQEYGTAITLEAVPDGGKRTTNYRFLSVDADGNETVIQEGNNTSCSWVAPAAGTYILKVEAADPGEDSPVFKSKNITFEILKAEHPAAMPPSEIKAHYTEKTLTNKILADTAGWEFESEDLGTPLTVGQPVTFTVHYVAADRDNYNSLSKDVTVTRSECIHDGGTDIRGAVEETCETEGSTGDVYCSLCGKLIKNKEVIPPAGHVWDTEYTVEKEATCTEEGSESIHCVVCGAVNEDSIVKIDKTEHYFSDWEIIQEPTAYDDGFKARYCYYCLLIQTEPVGKNDSSESTYEDDDSIYQTGADGTALGQGASVEAAEAAIASMTSDSDLPGSVFNKLQLRSKKQTNTSISLSWKKVSGAKKYVIYGNQCGKTKKMKRLAVSTGKTKKFTKVLGKKLKKGTYYKFMIVALDSDDKVVSSSKIIHVATKGGKVGNVSKVITKAKKNKVTVKKAKTFKLAGKQIAASKKLKVKVHRKVSYESSNPKIAKVSKKGVITGKKRGSCYVYAYAQNGVFAKIKVTVK